MKFKHYLESITGVGIYPMVSLLIFFIFFSLLSIWVFKANKQYIHELKQIPFPGSDNDSQS